ARERRSGRGVRRAFGLERRVRSPGASALRELPPRRRCAAAGRGGTPARAERPARARRSRVLRDALRDLPPDAEPRRRAPAAGRAQLAPAAPGHAARVRGAELARAVPPAP